MTKHWNFDEARGMRAEGMTWCEIGRIFGISAGTARRRTEPQYAARRRAQINANRKPVRSFGKREHVHHVVPEIAVEKEEVGKVFETASGLRAYQVERDGSRITLPFVSIQHRAESEMQHAN